MYVLGHQDDEKECDQLDTSTKLNVDDVKIVISNIQIPTNSHLLTKSFVVYVNNQYAPSNIYNEIRSTTFEDNAKKSFQLKYD